MFSHDVFKTDLLDEKSKKKQDFFYIEIHWKNETILSVFVSHYVSIMKSKKDAIFRNKMRYKQTKIKDSKLLVSKI